MSTIPQSTPATVLRALEVRGEISQSDPQLNFLIAHLCHKIIPEAGMTRTWKNMNKVPTNRRKVTETSWWLAPIW